MGIERIRPARYWRMRAEEFRTKADNCQYAPTRESLRKVAENYEQLARSAERTRTVQELIAQDLVAKELIAEDPVANDPTSKDFDERRRDERRRVVEDYAEDPRLIAAKLRSKMN